MTFAQKVERHRDKPGGPQLHLHAAAESLTSRLRVLLLARRWDMKKRCDSCGGRFGLTRHKWFGYHFCREACKKDFLVKLAGQREQLRLWLGYFARGSTT